MGFEAKGELTREGIVSAILKIDHLKNSIAIATQCPFSDCSNRFETKNTTVQNFQCHVSSYHKGI
jgi:hypothetical protein